jgi:hypothetical protein
MLNQAQKKDWIEKYKKTASEFKNEEKRLIQTFIAEDFHINKIFISLKEEIDSDKKTLDDTRENIKFYIDEAYSFFKGVQKAKNYDIKQRSLKIKEALLKNRIENKNKFETLLQEEEALQKELEDFELEWNRTENINTNNEDDEEESENNFKLNIQNNNIEIYRQDLTKNGEIDEYIEYVMNSANIVFEKYSDEDINKIVARMNDLTVIKNKTGYIDFLIEKLGGINLTWQNKDHQDFLRLKALHNGKVNTYDFLTALENTLPFIPRSELKTHIKLYNKYHQLFELKKLLVNRYKAIKQVKDDQDKKQILEKLNKDPTANRGENIIKLSQEEKAKLDEWKIKKADEKRIKEDEDRRIESAKREQERQKYVERSSKVKPMLDEYKKQKEFEKQIELENQNVGKERISEIDLERVKERNDKLLESKKLISRVKPYEKIQRAMSYTKFKLKKMEKLEQLEPKIDVPTAEYENKKRKKHDYVNNREANTMGGNVLQRTTRAIPEWRRCLY